MGVKVIAILKDSKTNETKGVKAVYDDGELKKLSTNELIKAYNKGFKFDNAILLSSGFVRSKKGNLPIEVINTDGTKADVKDKKEAKELLSGIVNLYHGTKYNNLIPRYLGGSDNNDYGNGFYTTPVRSLAMEWAYAPYTTGGKGYLYTYELSLAGLNILNLTECSVLNWVAELLANRDIDEVGEDADVINYRKEFILSRYKLNTSEYDIIIGYRADDSMYSYVMSFLNGLFSLEDLTDSIRFGSLGLQVFFKSKRAFSRLNKSSADINIVPYKYKEYYDNRISGAKSKYRDLKKRRLISKNMNGTYITDIVRG